MDESHAGNVEHSTSAIRKSRRAIRSNIISVVSLALLMTVSGVESGFAKPSPAILHGEVKATTAKVIQVQVADRVLPVPSNVVIRDEEGYTRRVEEVYRGVLVVLHIKKGKIVAITLLDD